MSATYYHIDRCLAHLLDMWLAMHRTEVLLGVPYGPALCEVRPPRLVGIVTDGQ